MFLRKFHTIFNNNYTNLRSCQQYANTDLSTLQHPLDLGSPFAFLFTCIPFLPYSHSVFPSIYLGVCCYVILLQHRLHGTHTLLILQSVRDCCGAPWSNGISESQNPMSIAIPPSISSWAPAFQKWKGESVLLIEWPLSFCVFPMEVSFLYNK